MAGTCLASHRIASHRVAAFVLLLPSLLLLSNTALAAGLTANSQLGVSQMSSKWRVWARSENGAIVTRWHNPMGEYRWTNHGYPAGASPCMSAGVTATSWTDAGSHIERGFCVAQNQHLYQLLIVNGVPQGWADFATGIPGHTLSGKIAATSWVAGSGHWTVFVFATTNDNHFVYFQQDTVTGAASWTDPDNLANYSATAQIAASRAPGATPSYIRVFYARTNGNVQVRRWNQAGNWSNFTVTKPAGVNMFATAAAAEDQIAGSDGSTYQIFLFCTSTTQSNKLWALRAKKSDPVAGDYSWVSLSLGTGQGNFANSGYAIAATTRADGATRAIEGFALSTGGSYPPERVYRTKFVSGSGGPSTLWDIGLDGETAKRKGGLAAYDDGGISVISFIGSGSGDQARHLYSKFGSESSGNDPWNWANHQSGQPWVQIVSLGGEPHAETSAAFFNQKGIVAGIVHPGQGGDQDFQYVQTNWTTSDGHSWNGNWVNVTRTVEGTTYDLASDPTVDFDDAGTAYATVLGSSLFQHVCTDNNYQMESAVYYVTTQNGSDFTAPELVASGQALDHPWMEIYRDPGGPDRVHFIWADSSDNHIWYTSMVNGVPDAPHDLGPGAVPILTVGAGGTVYAQWDYKVCRIAENTWDRCRLDPPQEFDQDHQFTGQTLPIPGTDPIVSLRTLEATIVASASDPDLLYYAFHKHEADGDDYDVFFSVGTYDTGTDWITWSSVTPLTDVTNDDADQFQPGIAVAQGSGDDDYIFASWYDRRNVTCGAGNWANRCYRPKRSVSFNGGTNFLHTQDVPVDASNSLSDPDLLERHCSDRGRRFLGDYHAVRGDRFHTFHVVTGAPVGSPTTPTSIQAAGWVSDGYYYW